MIELLLVVAIIGILASLLLPVLVIAKLKAQGTYCMNNLKQMGIAWNMYLMGRDPTQLDSHQHVHRNEPLRSILLRYASPPGLRMTLG